MHGKRTWLLAAAVVAALGCAKDEATSPAPAASSAAAPPASAPPPIASATPSAAASVAEPPHDCPPGSSGSGSYAKPCDAKGSTRMMDVKWTKTDDKGPSFSVKNASKLTVVWGRVAVYFYDKAGKQLDVKDDTGKTHPYHTCSGQIFGGPMNAGDKYVIQFSCVPKRVVPDGAASIEAETQMVGFADAGGKKIDFYWRNGDLTPDVRPKGGVKG